MKNEPIILGWLVGLSLSIIILFSICAYKLGAHERFIISITERQLRESNLLLESTKEIKYLNDKLTETINKQNANNGALLKGLQNMSVSFGVITNSNSSTNEITPEDFGKPVSK